MYSIAILTVILSADIPLDATAMSASDVSDFNLLLQRRDVQVELGVAPACVGASYNRDSGLLATNAGGGAHGNFEGIVAQTANAPSANSSAVPGPNERPIRGHRPVDRASRAPEGFNQGHSFRLRS